MNQQSNQNESQLRLLDAAELAGVDGGALKVPDKPNTQCGCIRPCPEPWPKDILQPKR